MAKWDIYNAALTVTYLSLFHDGGLYHIETSPLTCSENQWTGFYIIGSSVMKEFEQITLKILVEVGNASCFMW